MPEYRGVIHGKGEFTMSLMKTLAKLAIGVAVAKGAKAMMNQGSASASSAGQGGIGGLLSGLAGKASGGGMLDGSDDTLRRAPERNDHNFGEVLNSQFDETPVPAIEPSRDQEAAAALMLAAMIQAAKSDGRFDEDERQKLLGKLGDVDTTEAAFVKRQMALPVDIDALVRQTPAGLEAQVYAMSLLGIDLDTQEEAQYLHKLAQGYGMAPDKVNQIHAQMGVPSLYT